MAAAATYRIRHHDEESVCNHCGYPLYVGDSALEDNSGIYCCNQCAVADRKYRRDHEAQHSRFAGVVMVATPPIA